MTPRATLRLAKPEDLSPPLVVKRLEHESDAMYERRSAAIAALGKNWQGHACYLAPARHSLHESIWMAARTDYLAGIALNAALARSKNSLFLRNEQLRKIAGSE